MYLLLPSNIRHKEPQHRVITHVEATHLRLRWSDGVDVIIQQCSLEQNPTVLLNFEEQCIRLGVQDTANMLNEGLGQDA